MDNFVQNYLVNEKPIKTEAFSQKQIFDFGFLKNRILPVHWTVPDTLAAAAGSYGVFWIAPFDCVVMNVWEAHQTAGTNGGAVTLQIEKLTGTQALDAGTAMLITAIDLKGAINTVVNPALSKTLSSLQLARGNRLALKDAGTLTAVNNVTVLIEIKY